MKRPAAPGQLKHRVIIEQPIACQPADPLTDEPQCWQTVTECWAAIRPVSAKEIFAAGGFVGQSDVAVTVRYDPKLDDMTHTWRIWWQNRKLGVAGVLNIDARDKWLKILTSCSEDSIRLNHPDFDEPLQEVVHVIMPELT